MSKQKREENRGARAAKAAAIQRAQARRERNIKIVAVVGVIAIVSAIVAFAVISSSNSGSSAGSPSGTAVMPAVQVKNNVLYAGNPKAKIKVEVYEDFQCPYCREFEESSRDFLRADAKEGKVYVAYRPFQIFTGPPSSPATIAYSKRALESYGSVLLHGTPQQALKFHDLLYDKQPYEESNDKPDVSKLISWAKKVGATSPAVADGMKSPDTAFFNAAQAAADAAKVQGTPTIYVNGKQLQGQTVDQMASNLETMIAQNG